MVDSTWSTMGVLLTGYIRGLCEKLRHLWDVAGGERGPWSV